METVEVTFPEAASPDKKYHSYYKGTRLYNRDTGHYVGYIVDNNHKFWDKKNKKWIY
ncbi:MAG: hypothetical protein HUJ56_07480 [Erysipelotrichaceae bacterium]|nr:hypothetical protein [Erysipelotrichaceae bacterium]